MKQAREYTAYLFYVELLPNSTQLKKTFWHIYSDAWASHKIKKPIILFKHPIGEYIKNSRPKKWNHEVNIKQQKVFYIQPWIQNKPTAVKTARLILL